MGERHVFIRFEECNIHCEYCDELDKLGIALCLDQVMEQVRELEREEGPHTFVSLTGGEPLIYLPFIKPLMARLKAEGFRIYLETSGILWKALEDVVGGCDCIAMDMKPASVTKEKNFYGEHRLFLDIAKAKEVFIKIILSKEIELSEYEALIEIVAERAPNTPVILQPISTEVEGHEDPDLMRLLTELQRVAMRQIRDVRIIPRFHKILKIR